MTTTVDSMTQAGAAYTVTIGPRTATCTCPHYQFRLAGTQGECKHLKQARAERAAKLAEKAAALSLAELEALLPRYEAEKRLDVALAIRAELWARQQAVRA